MPDIDYADAAARGELIVSRTTYNAYQLANMADCAGPDNNLSAGADWLETVAISALEILEDDDNKTATVDDLGDTITEVADQVVPVYTYEKWKVFIDLAAWTEQVDEFGPLEDMDSGASRALYMIAERLIRAIIEDKVEERDDEDDDELDHNLIEHDPDDPNYRGDPDYHKRMAE